MPALAEVFAVAGTNVRRAREAAGLSQADLASAAGVVRSSIANFEAGRQALPLDKLAAVAIRLGVSVGALIGEVPLILPAVVEVVCDAWVVRCSECGTVGVYEEQDTAEASRGEHLREAHGHGG